MVCAFVFATRVAWTLQPYRGIQKYAASPKLLRSADESVGQALSLSRGLSMNVSGSPDNLRGCRTPGPGFRRGRSANRCGEALHSLRDLGDAQRVVAEDQRHVARRVLVVR